MKKIRIANNIESSVIGFGCAPILGSVSAKKAQRAIDIALDCGVTHFDLARSYGYGEAESFVGRVLKNKRRDVVIATKFGIMANWKATFLSPLKPLVRYLKGHPTIKNIDNPDEKLDAFVQVKPDRFHDRLPITVSTMTKSVEKSLEALKTDFIDILFIHEPLNTISEIDLVLEYAERLKKDGKIRCLGLACMQYQMPYHKDYLNLFDVIQFNNSPGLPNYEEIKVSRSNTTNIFFSPFNGGTKNFSPKEKLLKLSTDFPKSVILCSMFSEKHIKSNTELF